ncbi:invasin/ intimin like protein [Salmonella phage SE_PL]|uniref:Ig-like domain-containing protein n=1 Tax=Salmonella enterica TaxID=28901 RepID=UPI000FDF7B97|nr:invasin/intimin-like protein [Salmonella phage Munch]EAZ2022925.1 Ig domain-containing protein [Salmonella enterica]ECV9084059.1 Ig domain-containing protein [Salmonella enterica subsp. enterica serovar Infantis]MCP0435839.1 Ig-like domain-containing protein [Salmonella enterica subsp. enterica serovar Mbandaka]QCW18812.1 putative structural protein [Salmonella phage 7t3]QIG62905.1 invasin/ intimin like protein [Salmonella phage SE_PL]WNV47240.1 hypothetical protein [Klebsiella phage fENko
MKPIAKFGELPFNVGGINVFAAVDNEANPIDDKLFIINERSTRIFDLVNEGTDKIYSFMKMVSKDKNFKDLPLSATAEEIKQSIGKNQYVVKVYDLESGDVLGYAYKFFTHKIILSNGLEVDIVDYNAQTTEAVPPEPTVVNVESVSVEPSTVSGAVGDPDVQLVATILPENATDKSVSWESDNVEVATISSTGLVKFISTGTANITVVTTDGAKQAIAAVTVS